VAGYSKIDVQIANATVYTFVCCISDDKMPVVTRLTLLMLCLIVYVMIKFRAMEDGMLYRYVSWNEFIHNMLAKGEVGTMIYSITHFIRHLFPVVDCYSHICSRSNVANCTYWC